LSITREDLHFLTSADGRALLDAVAEADLSEANTLSLTTKLRQHYNADQVRAALSMARLRVGAVEKFGSVAAQMFFTEEALQQASHPAVRQYRQRRFEAPRVLDACCGIGADSFAFADAGAEVLGLDIDPLRVEMAQLNAQVLDLPSARFEVADVRHGLPSGFPQIFFDPARRDSSNRRIYDVEQYVPPLSVVRGWQAEQIAVKLSPGVRLEQLAAYGGAVEFISVEGDLKEALLHLGDGAVSPVATLLANGEAHHWYSSAEPDVPVEAPRAWLIEPDPALLRAGLVRQAVERFNGAMLDHEIAYFTTHVEPQSPWVRVWQVLDWMPFHLKRLRAYLRERDVGTVTVKKRGSPLTPEQLISKLKLNGSTSRTLVLTRLKGQPIIVICADYTVK
jgi:SAM-dependent methyltransferase